MSDSFVLLSQSSLAREGNVLYKPSFRSVPVRPSMDSEASGKGAYNHVRSFVAQDNNWHGKEKVRLIKILAPESLIISAVIRILLTRLEDLTFFSELLLDCLCCAKNLPPYGLVFVSGRGLEYPCDVRNQPHPCDQSAHAKRPWCD